LGAEALGPHQPKGGTSYEKASYYQRHFIPYTAPIPHSHYCRMHRHTFAERKTQQMKRIVPIITISFLLTALFSLTSCISKIEPPENGLPKDSPSEGLEIRTVTDENGRSCLAVVGIGSCKDTKIVIPSERNGLPIEEISSRAFYESEGIVEVTVPDSVKRIGLFAFSGSKDLEKVTLCDGIDFIDESAFANCGKLDEVSLPSTLKYVGSYAFIRTALTAISVPDGIEYVGREVISETPYFTAPENWENGLLYAGSVLLASDPSLLDEPCTVKEGTKTIASAVFADASEGPTEIVLPDTVENIGDSVFSNCPELTKVTLSNSLKKLGFGSFSRCSALETVILPENLTEISNQAFSDCVSLTSVNISVGVTHIGSDAFPSTLTDVYFNGTEDQWNNLISIYSALETVTVHYGE